MQRLNSLTNELAALRGSTVTVWNYSVALQTLTIRLQRPGQDGNTHLVLRGCSRMEIAPQWLNSSLELSGAQYGRTVLVDSNVGARVECLSVEIERDVAPMAVAN